MLIAQISDLHIRKPGNKAYRIVDTSAFLPPVIATLNRFAPALDLVVLTGDLTDFGRPEEYAQLRELLQTLHMPFILLPGNHDESQQLARAFPDHAYLQGLGEHLDYSFDAGELRIVALDTSVPRQSHGELQDEQLQWLQDQLTQQADRPTIIAMHHPPFDTGIDHMDAIGLLRGRDELERIVAGHPQVKRIICGHLHRPIFQSFGNTVASTCPSTAHQVALDLREDAPSAFVMEPPGLHIHQWRHGRLVTHQAVVGGFGGPYPFHDENGALIDT